MGLFLVNNRSLSKCKANTPVAQREKKNLISFLFTDKSGMAKSIKLIHFFHFILCWYDSDILTYSANL